jgi:hypothetical protein
MLLLPACSEYNLDEEAKATGPAFDSGDAWTPPEDTSVEDLPGDDTGAGVETAAPEETGAPDPCTWEDWTADEGADGWAGTGDDGDVVLTTFTPPSTTLTADAGGATLQVLDTTGFAADDEVFVHARDGTYAFARVLAVDPTSLDVTPEVTAPSAAAVQRVPQYGEVVVSSDVSASRLVFRACGAVTVDARLGADGGGWAGGVRAYGVPELGWQGESDDGAGGQSDAANGTGGGGGSYSCNVHADGGGGGHATEGTKGGDYDSYPCGGPGGLGGGTTGDEALSALHFGGGGGGGYLDDDAGTGSYGGAGGAGGGVVYLVARSGFSGTGTISADGEDGEDGYWIGSASPGGGGGGAGGSVRLFGAVGVTVEATGGTGGIGSEAGGGPTYGGTGGDGRVRTE